MYSAVMYLIEQAINILHSVLFRFSESLLWGLFFLHLAHFSRQWPITSHQGACKQKSHGLTCGLLIGRSFGNLSSCQARDSAAAAGGRGGWSGK